MKNVLTISGLFLLALGLAACTGGSDAESEVATLVAAQLLTDEAGDASPPAASATAEPATSATPEPTDTEAAASGPEVVFLPGGLFDDAERNLIMGKVINPYIDYYADLADHPRLLTITIEHYEDDPRWLYTAEAIFETGIYEGWLLPATDGALDWWIPECMGPCPLSDDFRATYPDIAATVEP